MTFYIFGEEGINKESKQCRVYLWRLREELFYCVVALHKALLTIYPNMLLVWLLPA